MSSCVMAIVWLALPSLVLADPDAGVPPFYVPENPEYTIVDSVQDSIRFTLNRTVKPNAEGHLVSVSSFVRPSGEAVMWHEFGPLEGPGWAANAIGGAYEIYRFGTFLENTEWPDKALRILDHVIDGGFIDEKRASFAVIGIQSRTNSA